MNDTTSNSSTRNPAVLLLGPTGAGKTPLGDLIAERGLWGEPCLHFDFGENLRRIVDRGRPDAWVSQGEIDFLRDVLRSGALLENEHFPLAERILRSFLTASGAGPGALVLLNGLPRHVGQAEALDAALHVRAVIRLNCSPETVYERILANTGGDRTGRRDDAQEAIRNKLRIFHERTTPLVEHYANLAARVHALEVTAEMTAEAMWNVLAERSG